MAPSAPELPLPRLVAELISGAPAATRFLPAPPSVAGIVERARHTLATPLAGDELARRQRVAAALAATARRLGWPPARELDAWTEGRAVALVSGQQAGLLGGPLYTLCKVAGLAALARTLGAAGIPALPVFWIASEDHDFDEVRRGTLWTPEALVPLELPRAEGGPAPVGALRLGEGGPAVLARLVAAAPLENEQRRLLAAALAPDRTLTESFAAALAVCGMSGLGVALADPLEPALKEAAAPILAAMAERQPELRSAWQETSAALAQAGYAPQVEIGADTTQLFWIDARGRRRLRAGTNAMILDGESTTLSQWSARIAAAPASLSPGALLRPLLQDHLFAPAAVLLGPAELAYMAQARPAYALLGVGEPAWLRRPGMWLLEPRAGRLLGKLGLGIGDLAAPPVEIAARLAHDPGAEQARAALAALGDGLERAMEQVRAAIDTVGGGLPAAAAKSQRKMTHQVASLRRKLERALGTRDAARLAQIEYLGRALYPGGVPQERGVLGLSYALRHPELAELLAAELTPGSTHVLELASVPAEMAEAPA